MAIAYLTLMEKIHNCKIQHAENDGEYTIPDTRWKADGYCIESNTIYEFHGTIYHGDPRICCPADFNYLGKNFGELYENTKKREKVIEEMGYCLEIMWERDWISLIRGVVRLQRIFRGSIATA